MYGYHGKILQVDLNNRKTKDIALNEDDLKNFIGGGGLAARLLYPLMTGSPDPLGPQNPLLFITGPFTASPVPSSGRHTICARSPLTGVWGETSSGGFFGVAFKSTGYDGLLVTGRSAQPVYIVVHAGGVEIKDAAHLWGKGFYETRDALLTEVGEKRARVTAIGQGGEKLVRYAAVMNDDGRAAGRCGMGAVMGSKKLKAVVAYGDKRAPLADSAALKENIKASLPLSLMDLTALSTREMFRSFGTIGYIDMAMYLSDAPAKYFTKSIFPVEEINARALKEKYLVTSVACYGCPLGCGRLTRYGRHGIKQVDGPEYESAIALGPLCMNFDLDSLVYTTHLCNDYGLDTISAGVCIAFAMYLYEKGVLTRDKAGMELKWGDKDAIISLLEKIALREGVGDLLAEGVKRMADKLSVSQDEAAHVKGLEIPMHDPRAFFGDAVDYATAPRGACHTKGDYYMVDMGRGVVEADIVPGERFESSEDKGAMTAKYQNLRDLYNSLPMCILSDVISPDTLATLLNNITGMDFDANSLLKAGERSFNLKEMINVRLGADEKDNRLPRIATAPLSEGSSYGKEPDMETLLRGYYKERGWEEDTATPTRETLEQLGLSEVVKEI